MSTMTLRKRISLAAIGALTAGLLTSVATPVANATGGAGITLSGASTGIISAGAPLASAVTMASDGILVLDVASAAGAFSVSGGKIVGLTSVTVNGAAPINGSAPVLLADGSGLQAGASSGSNTPLALNGLQFKPTAAGTTMTIKEYGNNAGAIGAGTLVASGTLASYQTLESAGTTGVLKRTITVTVVPAGASGVYSTSSFFSIQAIGSSTATVADALYEDRASGSNQIRINYNLVDGLGAAMPSSTSVMAQVTSGTCLVSSTTTTGTLPVVSENAASGDFFVHNSSDPNAPTVCKVDISVGGTVRATKTLTYHGEAAKITVTKPFIGRNNGASSNYGLATGKALVTVTDSAGNTLGGVTVTADSATYGAVVSAASISGASGEAGLTANVTSSRPSDTLGTTRRNATAGSTPSTLQFTCTPVGGVANTLKLRTTLANGVTVIRSDVIETRCASIANTYEASLDKASYVAGDIATLTITAKDSSGRLVHDAETLGGGTTASGPSISGSQLTAVTAPSNGDTFTDGVKTYKYVVGSTTGSYNMVVDLPYINANSSVSQKAVTVAFKVTTSTTTVTNEEVLKSIVALIASINKQIQALQKLILARR